MQQRHAPLHPLPASVLRYGNRHARMGVVPRVLVCAQTHSLLTTVTVVMADGRTEQTVGTE